MLLSYTIVDFHSFFDGAVDIQIIAPLTRSECKVSDTRVTVKACGFFVHKCNNFMLNILFQPFTHILSTGYMYYLDDRFYIYV